MPKLSKNFKDAVEELSVDELRKLVIELAKKNQEAYDYIKLKYLSTDETEKELFDECKQKVLSETWNVYNRRNIQKNLAAAITRAIRHINYFEKVTKNEVLVAELLLILLNEVFDDFKDELGTCWTAFDSKLAITTNRLINLVTKKLHPDYLVEYREPINNFLNILHEKSGYLDCVYKLPKTLPE
ncbi:MAG: hypothetical protein IH598_07220 [Bacteroidales bacterium]|nr:hypothetical protein [Bacteroidales bacterium]